MPGVEVVTQNYKVPDEVKLCAPCAEAATRCAEEKLSKTRYAKLLPRLVASKGRATHSKAPYP